MKTLEYYLGLPYTVVLRRDEDGDYVARVDELQGCSAHGATPEEAISNLNEARELWISDCLENGDPVPEPVDLGHLPSGKWLQRVPRSLHRKLARLARNEGVSLNQLVTSILAEAAGFRNGRELNETARPARGEVHGDWAYSAQELHATQSAGAVITLTPKVSPDSWFTHFEHLKPLTSRKSKSILKGEESNEERNEEFGKETHVC